MVIKAHGLFEGVPSGGEMSPDAIVGALGEGIVGSSISGITLLLSREFSRWILLANIVAWPIAFYAMHKWLENYAYRTSINVALFLLAGVLSLVIAALPVGYQALKAASSNPVDALRYE